MSSSSDASGPAAAAAQPRAGARRSNGLDAASFVPLAELETDLGTMVLDALGRAKIAAYLEPLRGSVGRLYADATDRADARTILASVMRHGIVRPQPSVLDGAAGPTDSAAGSPPEPATPSDNSAAPGDGSTDGPDTDAQFGALIADWHVDTVAAIRSAERDLAREDADWRARLVPVARAEDEEEHYVPPPPPPLPRLAGMTIFALLIILASIMLIPFGGYLELDGDTSFLLGVAGILLGAGLLVMRLRERPDDEDDDGAIL